MIIRSPRVRPVKFVFGEAKRLLRSASGAGVSSGPMICCASGCLRINTISTASLVHSRRLSSEWSSGRRCIFVRHELLYAFVKSEAAAKRVHRGTEEDRQALKHSDTQCRLKGH